MSVPCFVTSNARYIPALAPSLPDKLFLRRDMRYGPDDPTLWPQQYSDIFCHMGAIPRKPTTEKGKQTLGIMWWNPERADFVCPTSGMTVTRGLGKLSHCQCIRLAELVNRLLDQYRTYAASLAAPAKTIALFPQLTQNLILGLERLQSVPSTFERMIVEVTCLQRSYLELQGLLTYMTIYKPRMEDPDAELGLPDDCMGVFTSDPKVAQQFRAARLPYWFLRPLSAFHQENILRVVTPLDPAQFLDLEPAPGIPPFLRCIFVPETPRGTKTRSVCRDPPSRCHKTRCTLKVSAPIGRMSRTATAIGCRHVSKNRSLSTKALHGPNPNAQVERDKFVLFDSPDMPIAIDRWAQALSTVDRTKPPSCGLSIQNVYVLPEPALLVSPKDDARRQLFLYHYQLIRDALLYRLGVPSDPHRPLSAQEWRDVLLGKVRKQGKAGSRAERRSVSIEAILGPAMRACGIDEMNDFATDPVSVPRTTRNRARELLWELAEMNFRFELLALDARASGLDRPDACRECFPSRNLVGVDLSESKLGFAHIASIHRLPYLQRLAGLMLAWTLRPRPGVISEAQTRSEWPTSKIFELESAVAEYYTRSFYDLFGRAPVIPMRLSHEFGT
ncbi:hypothetical protein B0H13DRAFT_1635742 [Mycena leptocephala]|nr:hypothetical protein B0H13DRAFT_1635742 [Mycena leptocephala]